MNETKRKKLYAIYAVPSCRTTGILYRNWLQCNDVVNIKVSGASLEGFRSLEDAERYLSKAGIQYNWVDFDQSYVNAVSADNERIGSNKSRSRSSLQRLNIEKFNEKDMSSFSVPWSQVVRPLLNVPYLEYNNQELVNILQLLHIKKEEFLDNEEDKYEAFFSSFAALSINYVINHIQKVPVNIDLEPTVKFLLQYLLAKCKSKDSLGRTPLTTAQLVGLIHSLCTARTSPTADLTTFAATLRAAVTPDYIISPGESIAWSDDSEAAEDGLVAPPSADTELKLPSAPTSDNTADSADGSATNDFLSSLQAYTMMSECQTESEERDKKQQLTELSSRLFNQALNGRATLIEFMSSLEYLQRYKDGLDTLISNGDMLSPHNYNSVNEFKSSVPVLLNHMSAVCKIASIPAMYITNNETEMKKVVRIVMSCIFAGSYAILCSAMSDSAELDNTLSPVTKKAIDILSALTRGVRQSQRLAKHMHTNIQTMCAWLIFSTLDTLTNQTRNKTPSPEAAEGSDKSASDKHDTGGDMGGASAALSNSACSSRWGLAAHSYALEGLSCLISIAKESLPGQIPNRSSSRASARLQEAQKYGLSQFNLAQEYTYLELLKFVCSGSTLRLSGILFSVTSALTQKYNSLLEARKQRQKQDNDGEKDKDTSADVAATQDNESTPVQVAAPRSSQTTPAPLLTMVSLADDDSVDSLTGVFNQLFVEDLFMDDSDFPVAPPEYQQTKSMIEDTNMINAWVDIATSYVMFYDKYIVSSPVLKDYLCSELSHTRSQQSLSLLAVLAKSTSDSNDDMQYHKFCMAIRRLCRHLIQKQILDKPAQENMLLMIDLFPDNLIGWPVSAHRNLLAILTEVILGWQTLPNWDKNQEVVVEMWRHFLDSVLSECVTANHNSKEIEDVNVEHCQAMLALLYTLSDDNKKQVFTYLCKTLMTALDNPASQLVAMIPLPITRLCLILEYMMCHLNSAPDELLQQVKDNILGEENKVLNFLHEGELEHTYNKNKKVEPYLSELTTEDLNRQPVFYKLCALTTAGQSHQMPNVDPLAMKFLMHSEDEELDLADFYKHCLTAMLVGSSLDKAKKKEDMTVMDSCAVHYHIKVVWRLLGLVPPPPAFLLQMTEVATLGTQAAALQAVRLAPRLRNADYVSWYKKTLKGTLKDAEIEGLLEGVINKTKSPSFEVQITLHIVQAQMATMMFASEGDVVDEKHLPGFHTIVTLDAVLSLTHALLDMHYQNLKDSVTAAGYFRNEGAADYEEARQMEFRRAVEDLLPALLLMLGSFTEFVRSSLLHQVTADEQRSHSAFAQLLTLSSAPDDMFNIFIIQPKELNAVIRKWKSDTFWQYPSLGGWRNFANMESPSEGFANAVIQAHCSTLSDTSDGGWSTVLPLRHLHMSLVAITTDISKYVDVKWFPAMNSSDELTRTLLPLMFDGSIATTSAADATACLNQVIGQVKVKEEKYSYMMRRWHSIMLGLPELSSSLSVDTNTQIVQVFSFFIQSCLEDNQIGQLLNNFYNNKAEFSDLLLVTGMPGCADIMSINRVLKIFTKLISLADANADNPNSHLLKSLNKLSSISQQVLCEWLQRIIMATPGQTDPTNAAPDIEGQVDKNAFLLHTIAAYMVKDNSLIEKEVPKAILQSLITVATGVLHQTHNAQGFQELMLIMSTLAKAGEVLSLFRAIIQWLDSCIPYMTTDSGSDETAISKHSLYVELASCLLSYINDVLTIIKGKGVDIHDEGIGGGRLWLDDFTSAFNLLTADEEDDVEASDLPTASANERSAEEGRLDDLLCTFTETQRDFRQQHWYHCYTCKMTDGVGVCSVCVKVCHKDHDVSYAKHGSFFCDCGEKGESHCKSLKKRTTTGKKLKQTTLVPTGASTSVQRARPSASKMMKAAASLRQRVSLSSLLTYSKEDVLTVVEQESLNQIISRLLKTLDPEYLTRYREAMPQRAASRVSKLLEDLSNSEKTCDSSDNLMMPHALPLEGTFDNVKPSFSGDQGTTIKQLINSHMIRRHIMCKVISSGGKGPLLAVANDKGKITILSNLSRNIEHKRRATITRTHSQTVPFTILSMSANPIEEDLIAVSGLKECHVLSLTPTGAVANTTILQPALDMGNFIVKTHWIPGDSSSLAIVTADFIKIYSLSVDVISPKYYYLLPAGKVRDVTFCLDKDTGLITILVMSSSGHVYTQTLNDESQAVHGSFYITNALEIDHPDITAQAVRVVLGGGASIYYSHALSLLMMSFTQGQTYASSLNPQTITVSTTNKITFTKGKGNSSTQPMVQWSEVYGHPGLIFCITQATNNPLALYIKPDNISIQEIRPTPLLNNGKTNGAGSKSSKVLDYEAVRILNSTNKAQTHVLLICEDGGLKIVTANEAKVDLWIQSSLNPSSPFASQKPPKKSVQSKSAPTVSVQLPIDFFESCTQTNDIEYGGNDILEIYNKNLIKQRLATTNQYIASTKTDLFKIEILNTSSSHVLVGVRVLIGSRLLSRLPSYIEICGRRKAVVADGPRWIDFPFTREEAIRSFNKIILTVGASTHSEHVTFVDSIKVYSKSKDAFGWSDDEASLLGPQTQTTSTTAQPVPALRSTTKKSTDESKDSEEISAGDSDHVYSPQAVTPIDRLLADSLVILSRFVAAKPPTAQTAIENKAIEDSACKLVELLPPRCVEQSVHMLLQSLHTSDSGAVNRRMDEIRVKSIDSWMSLSLDELNPCTYQLILEWVRQLGHARPHNLSLLASCAVEKEGFERRFLSDLVDRFNYLYARRPYNPIYAPACSPGLQNVRATVFALVDVIFIFAMEKQELMPSITTMCLQLLFSKDIAVRFACKQAMTRILRPKSKSSAKLIRSEETSTSVSAVGSAVTESRPVAETAGQQPAPQQLAPVPQPAANILQPVQIPPPMAVDLQDWLEQEPMIEPAMIDDLELAIALSLQEQDEDDDDDEAEEDDDADDDEDDDEFQMVDEPDVEPAPLPHDHGILAAAQLLQQPVIHAPPPAPAGAAEVDSDGGQLSAHSSTEGVQNIGLNEAQNTEGTTTVLPPAAGDGEGDTQQKKLLRELVRKDMISQGLGLLEKSNGLTSIPYLQVLLVLLSDLDTPDVLPILESHLTTILDRLVNFKQSTDSFMKRTDRGEVELVVLRLFSALMSRSHNLENTNQSSRSGGSSSAGSKMNVCAASVLIKASSLDFFLPLLKQLLHFWKSHSSEGEGTQLLRFTSANSAAKYDMAPFFLRQYVKEHPLDIFEVFPQLQTEMVLRLINQMKKLSDSSTGISPLTFSEDWTKILSEYMGVCEAFIRRQVRKLLNYICGSKENYRRVRDTNTIDLRMTTIREAAMSCGLHDNVNITYGIATTAIPYITLTSMVENVKIIQEIASSRCVNWQQYCLSTPGSIELLLVLCVQTNQALADSLISLLHSAIKSPTTSSGKPSAGSGTNLLTDEDISLHKQLITHMLTQVPAELFSEFLRVYLLQTNQTPLRSQTHSLVLTMYEQGTDREKNNLLKLLWPLWPQLSQYGKKAGMFVDLVGHMIIQTDLSVTKKQQFVGGVVDLLSHCNSQLKQHQNTNIYNMLLELVDLDGYYLEREPCMTCNDPEIPYSNLKLNNIKVDNKFTTTTQMIKLIGSHMISKIHIRITDIKKSKMVKTLTIYYSNRTVQSAVELKNRVGIWHQAKRVSLSSSQSDVKIDFTVPITACNLMIEYSEFYENNQATLETLPCPRCSASVPAVPGICVNCGENVFQCHKCRSINYDEKDPFLCNTCGFCKYAKFEMTLTARSCSAVDPIETEEDRNKTLSSVNSMLEKADKTYSEIQNTRSTLESLIMQLSGCKSGDGVSTTSSTTVGGSAAIASNTTSASVAGHVNKFIQQVAVKYCDESKKHFDELSKSMQKVLMSRRELLEFDRKQSYEATAPMTPSVDSVASQSNITDQLRLEAEINEQKITKKLNMTQQSSSSCYGCLSSTVSHCITLLHALSTQSFSKFGEERLIRELVASNLNSGPLNLRRDSMLLLCTLTKGNLQATTLLHEMLYERITEAMDFCTTATSLAVNTRSEMAMISLSVDCGPALWEERMKTVIRIYSRALQTNKSHVIEAVALTCLEIIKGQIITSKPTTMKHRDKSLQDISGVMISSGSPAFDIQNWLQGRPGFSYEDWKKSAKLGIPTTTTQSAQVSSDVVDNTNMQRKYFDLWRRNIKSKSSLMSELNEKSWLSHILFNPSSQSSREMSAEIISQIAEIPERRQLLVAFLTKLLHKVPAAGTNASHFINLYKKLIAPNEVKYYLLVKHDILSYIADIVTHEIEELSHLEETTLGSDLSQGWGLQALVSIIKSFTDIEIIRQRYKGKLVGAVLDGYLSLRKLVVQRTKMIESTQDLLLGLLEQLTTGTEAETRDFMSVCIQTVAKYSPTDLRSPVFIFERLCSIIRPEESAASDFLMILEKDPQQEDFLQGRMSGNPYVSKEPGLGPLMRDVKNKICTDCELVALLEDDSGMELLVNNKIISLDLPVADVYRKIWQPARENEPMRIVYRMRGLLGDATEDMVNTLASNNAEEEDSEMVYRMASVLQQCGGIDVMLKRLGYIHNYHRGKQLVSVLLKLFHYCLKLKVNRVELIKPEKDTISVMLRALNRALRVEQQVMSTPAAPGQGQSITEKVLHIMEIVLSEASHLPPDRYTEFTKRCGDSDQLTLLLDRINSPFVRNNPPVLEALMKLIPFLACGEQEKMKTLIDHFKPYLSFPQFDIKHTDNEVTYLECFCVITSGIKQNANGSRLKQMIIDRAILADAIEYITILAPPVKTLLATDTEDWKEFISRASLPYVIRFLTGLCSGHAPSQEIVGEAMVPILHKLEHMSSHGQIGSLAENLMETLCQSEKVNQQIKNIRKQTKAEKKRLAMAVREKHLTSIGMKTNKKGQVVVTSSVLKEAEAIKDETGVICSICREGYHNQPNKVLAVYTFTKRVNIEEGELRSRKVQGLFTVSHMNVVHIDCHASAVRLASGRDEWESAALHNANTRCNGLLPMWGPEVSESNFAAALAKHNSYLRNSTELRDDSYTLTVHDIKLLLLRFAHEQPFSSDSGGGGRNSNMLLIPYELLLALYVINTQRSAKTKEKNLQNFLDAESKYIESSYEVEGPNYWLVMTLLLWSRQTWNQNKIRLLERLLILTQARHLSPTGCTVLKDASIQAYSVYKPTLVLFGIVDAIFNSMFKAVPATGEWNETLMTYIRNNDVSLAESSEKIISTYESELLPCESLDEMFDVIGLLGEIASPEEWLKGVFTNVAKP